MNVPPNESGFKSHKLTSVCGKKAQNINYQTPAGIRMFHQTNPAGSLIVNAVQYTAVVYKMLYEWHQLRVIPAIHAPRIR